MGKFQVCFKITENILYFSFRNKNRNPTAVSNVAKQYLKCLLTQFGDRKLFLYLFKFSVAGKVVKYQLQLYVRLASLRQQ